MLRVVFADPDPFFSGALALALRAECDIDVLATHADERHTVRVARKCVPDLVVTELELASGSGLGIAGQLCNVVPVLVLTRHHEGDVLLAAVAAGAVGCISHETPLNRLGELLHRVRPGHFVVDDERLHAALLGAAAPRDQYFDVSAYGLTARETEVLSLVGLGLDNEEIAVRLHVSAHTVRTHVGRILCKLGLHSRADAARFAATNGNVASAPSVVHLRGPVLRDG